MPEDDTTQYSCCIDNIHPYPGMGIYYLSMVVGGGMEIHNVHVHS